MLYYTYAYLREDRTPYYIGKGKGNRVYKNEGKSCNKPKDKSRIIFLKQNLTEEDAFKHEIYMISVFGRKDLGAGILHNRTDGGEGVSGYIVSEETRKKLSEMRKGKTLSEETKRKVSAAGKGRTHSEETKIKISEAHKGRTFSEEHKIKIGELTKEKWKNGTFTEDSYKKWKEAAKNISDETKRKISEANKGRTHSEETKRKLSETQKGKSHSEETKRKMSEAQKKRRTLENIKNVEKSNYK
jgi:hypothetical protein